MATWIDTFSKAKKHKKTLSYFFYWFKHYSIFHYISIGITYLQDQWKVYHNISSRLQLSHGTVNRSLNFVDPATGIHTQAIESYWAKAKQKFKEMKGVSSHLLPSYLDERMWRDRWGTTGDNAFNKHSHTYFRTISCVKVIFIMDMMDSL